MSKRRKPDATRLDEVDRSMNTSFCSAANSLSHLYSQAMNHQRLSFQAGERHALEKLFQWILRQQEEGTRVTTADIVSSVQNELEYGAEEPPMSPRLSLQQMHINTLSAPFSSTPISASTVDHGVRSGDYQAKNSEFSNAIACPVRGSLQHCHSVHHQVGYDSNNVIVSSSAANRYRDHETNYSSQVNGDTNPAIVNDCMDMPMHSDSPLHELPF